MDAQKAKADVVLRVSRASKTFGPVIALAEGDIEVRRGEVHALVGENGAGKSTLVKIMAGLYHPDSGEIVVDGVPRHFRTVIDSKAAGISVIYQEPTLFPDLSVAENIFVGRQPRTKLGLIDKDAMRRDAVALFDRLGVAIDPDRPAEGLSIADQQIIEIAKAISIDAKVLIMDEPTAALSGVEVERLFAVARGLRDEGAGLIFISHRFDEVFSLCDRVTVMRDGRYIATHVLSEMTVEEIVREMVGRDIDTLFPKEEAEIGDPVLVVDGLCSAGSFSDVSFTVRSGEIVALAGLVGAGRSEVARAVFGIDPYDAGTVTFLGEPLARDTRSVMEAGVAFVPEDRRRQGLVMELPISRNIALTLRRVLARAGLIDPRTERNTANEWAKRLQVKFGSMDDPVLTLSGGNQQKVVLAKWLATNPKMLIIDEPTRGIDVGTKAEVHRLISDLAGRGIAVLMISSELPEVLGMADRIFVMSEGRITAELPQSMATQEAIMHAAAPGVAAADAVGA